MFSYKPLSDLLKERKVTLKSVASDIGMSESVLRGKMNNNEYVTMEVLDKLCSVLKVPIEDIIKWQKGEQNVSERIDVDWEFIDQKLSDAGISLSELSVKCRLNKSTLFYARKRGSRVHPDVVKSIAKQLGCEMEELRKNLVSASPKEN